MASGRLKMTDLIHDPEKRWDAEKLTLWLLYFGSDWVAHDTLIKHEAKEWFVWASMASAGWLDMAHAPYRFKLSQATLDRLRIEQGEISNGDTQTHAET